jgi:choline-sulfatase
LEGTAGPARISLQHSGVGQSGYEVHDEYVTAATVDYFNRLGVARRSGQSTEPFCLTVGFMLPHQPFVARRQDFDRYRGRMTLPSHPLPFSDELHPHFQAWRRQTGIETVSDEEVLCARTAYWALVTSLDRMLGQIVAALHANDLAENTLIVYTSDHGEQVGEHGLWWKQTFYEQSVRVPGVLSWPGVLRAGTRSRRIVSALDLVATILDALHAPPLPTANGRSLLGLLTDAAEQIRWEDQAFSEYCTDDGCYQRMLRRGPWKLNYYHGQPSQLFNLEADPNELHDCAGEPAFQSVRADLTRQLLGGWDPRQIAETMARKRQEGQLLAAWVRQVRPPDQYRWDMLPEMNYLDEGPAR